MTFTTNQVSSRPQFQVTSQGQPLQLQLPSLTYASSNTGSVADVDERFQSERRFDLSDTYIDMNDEITDDYDSSMSSWGMHTASYAHEDYYEAAEANVAYTTTTTNHYELQQFCREHDGVGVGTTPTSVINDRKVWIDWLDCIRTWKETMPKAVVNCIDWSKVNPADYLLTADGRLVLID